LRTSFDLKTIGTEAIRFLRFTRGYHQGQPMVVFDGTLHHLQLMTLKKRRNTNDFAIVAQHTQEFDFLKSKIVAGATYDRSQHCIHQIKANPKSWWNDGVTTKSLEVRPDLREFQITMPPFLTTPAKNTVFSLFKSTYRWRTLKYLAGITLKSFTHLEYATHSQGFSPPSVNWVVRPNQALHNSI
jgi:hypothetical protein